MTELLELHISPYLLNWISAALWFLNVELLTSEPTAPQPGLPEGSPLSPVIFNAYTVR